MRAGLMALAAIQSNVDCTPCGPMISMRGRGELGQQLGGDQGVDTQRLGPGEGRVHVPAEHRAGDRAQSPTKAADQVSWNSVNRRLSGTIADGQGWCVIKPPPMECSLWQKSPQPPTAKA